MLFNAPALLATTLLALTATAPVSAVDYRLLANKPASASIDSFKVSFKTQCPFFNPTTNTNAKHRSSFFVPGDWQGQNTDCGEERKKKKKKEKKEKKKEKKKKRSEAELTDASTAQALVYCTYTNPNGTVFAVTTELVNSLGGSIA
ncbi:hypothetical protein B9479_005560 [Cryptococcus floricola]|uniref:Uncharacterized protein n=1 Tax=Cryptococcus floricola TaxID=2591691 RepID=A0A5D3AUQ0_9TREE|nr:hypothetical protein B9479_005560 [Cryptococcus floricola]